MSVLLHDKVNSLDFAHKNTDAYSMYGVHTAATSSSPHPSALLDDSESLALETAFSRMYM